MTSHQRRFVRTPALALALLCGATLAAGVYALRHGAAAAQERTGSGIGIGDPVTKAWLLDVLRARRFNEEQIVRLVEGRSSAFLPDAEEERELRAAGATDRVLEAVRKNFRFRMLEGGGGPGPNGPEPDYTRPFTHREVTKKIVITYKPEPGYTDEALKNGVEGVVRLRAVLNVSGEVTDISVVKGLPDGLTEKAIAAAKKIRFNPAEKDGRKVSQYVVLEYNFYAPVEEKELDERAVILEKPEPEYPEAARRDQVTGTVVLKVTLTSLGVVVIESVEERLPYGLTEKAMEAARRIKFRPATRKGRPVSQTVTVEYKFGL